MRRLRFTPAADRDLIAIFDYIADASGSAENARRFTAAIEAQCVKLAKLGTILGRARRELRSDLRSIPFRSYIIFFRYLGDDTLEIVHIIERHRDVAAVFAEDADFLS